jgi:hypothetical protein
MPRTGLRRTGLRRRRRRLRFARRAGFLPTGKWTMEMLPRGIMCDIAAMLHDSELMPLARTCRRHRAELPHWPRSVVLRWCVHRIPTLCVGWWPPQCEPLFTSAHNVVAIRCVWSDARNVSVTYTYFATSGAATSIAHAPRLRELDIPFEAFLAVARLPTSLTNLTSLRLHGPSYGPLSIAGAMSFVSHASRLAKLSLLGSAVSILQQLIEMPHVFPFARLRSLSFPSFGFPWWKDHIDRLSAFLPALTHLAVDCVRLLRYTPPVKTSVSDVADFARALPALARVTVGLIETVPGDQFVTLVLRVLHMRTGGPTAEFASSIATSMCTPINPVRGPRPPIEVHWHGSQSLSLCPPPFLADFSSVVFAPLHTDVRRVSASP